MNDYEHLTETKIDSREIFDGKILNVTVDTVRLPNGENALREVAHHRGAVCVIPVFDNGDILVERQYRYAAGELMTEIPAGKLEYVDGKLEDPLKSAVRELEEETGYTAKNVEYMGALITSPAILTERIYMYKATGLCRGKKHLDADEFLECERIPLKEMYIRVMNGEIPDAKTQIAVLKLYSEELRKQI